MVTNYNSTSICMHDLYACLVAVVKLALECAEVNAESNAVKLSTSSI